MADFGAGSLDRRITIRRPQVSLNDFNEAEETFSDHATVWAMKRDVSAGESFRAREVASELTTRFTVRHSSDTKDVDTRDRIIFDGKTYNIVSVREIQKNRFIEIDAVRREESSKVTFGS